jgi:cytochrome c-type biogenesis protein
MDFFFELIGRMATSVQSSLYGQQLSVALLAIVMATGLVAGLTPYGVTTTVLVGRQLSQDRDSTRERRMRGAAVFALGGTVSLLAVGVVAAFAGKIALDYRLARYLPLLTLLMGLQMAGVGKLLPGRLGLGKLRLREKLRRPGEGAHSNMFLLGLPFGVIAPPCTAPIIVTVLSVVAARSDLVFGLVVLLVFAVGRSVPLVAACTYGDALLRRTRLPQSASAALVKGVGLVIAGVSVYFLTAGSIYFGG